jgi:epoxide hydrolase
MVHTVVAMKPFRIDIPQADLDDLHTRLAMARWPQQLPGDGWSRGVPVSYLRSLADYWRVGYDWRAAEARLNEFPQFITSIDGTDIHFLHVRSPAADALPLILTHGWPNSFAEFTALIDSLTTQGFHVVVPSIPGFGFSGAPHDTSWDAARVARTWAALMQRLGYSRYGAQGGDFGAYVAPELAKAAPDNVVGVYVISGLGFPTQDDDLNDTEQAAFADMMNQDWMNGVDHHTLLRAAPQTFAYGWTDSPIAALAWMTQKFHEFNPTGKPLEEVISRDQLLTNLSIYWFTGTFTTSSWPYYSSTGFAWPQGQKTVPTGVYSGPPGIRRLAEKTNTITHWPTANPPGHHFIAMDHPTDLATDMREFFTKLR